MTVYALVCSVCGEAPFWSLPREGDRCVEPCTGKLVRRLPAPQPQEAPSAANLWDDLRFRSAIVPYSVPEHYRLSPEEFFALLEAVKLLGRLNDWDALNPPTIAPYGDAAHWKAEMERVLAPFGNLRQREDHGSD